MSRRWTGRRWCSAGCPARRGRRAGTCSSRRPRASMPWTRRGTTPCARPARRPACPAGPATRRWSGCATPSSPPPTSRRAPPRPPPTMRGRRRRCPSCRSGSSAWCAAIPPGCRASWMRRCRSTGTSPRPRNRPLPTQAARRHAAGNPAQSPPAPGGTAHMTNAVSRRAAMLGAAATSGSLLLAGGNAGAQTKPTELRVGITTFLSGAASVFGVPAKQTAEMLFEEINKAGGIGGVPVKAFFVDEAPGTDHLVGEYRRLVQNEGVHIVFASISSGSCLACTPLSDEMKKTTLLWDCGTQRIFEEGPHPYAFRTQGYGTPEVLAPLLYLLKHKPDFRTLAVINQDYAWGRDSWELWRAAMDVLKPGVRVVAEMFPRFGATDFSTEVTRLLAARPDVILSTAWGGDLVTLVRQAAERRLFDRSTFVLPVAEASLQILGRTFPAGHVIGARGDHWNNHPAPK